MKDQKPKNLAFSELVCALFCGYLIYMLLDINQNLWDLNLLLPGFLLIYIILQGALYLWMEQKIDNNENLDLTVWKKCFVLLKKSDIALFLLIPIMLVVYNLVILQNIRTLLYGVVTLIICLAEYYNYYISSLNIRNWKTHEPSGLNQFLKKEETE